jgi:sialate O-acetylesterase
MENTIKTWLLCGLSVMTLALRGEVKLAHIFSDNMVLQQNQPVKVWGTADRNETVEVSFCGQTKKGKADKNGNWMVQLAPGTVGGPYAMEVKGKNSSVTLGNILIGEVWLCSGQSNMEWTVANSMNAAEEMAQADFPQIRVFTVKKDMAFSPQADLSGSWEVCSPETVGHFSAVGYFFVRKLYQELQVPVGLINSSWGGTDVETWTSGETFFRLPEKYMARYQHPGFDTIEDFIRTNVERKKAFEQALEQDRGMEEGWFDPSYDAGSWEKMTVPEKWDGDLAQADGIIWFRYDFELPEHVAGKKARVHLGPVDDNDVTWINGRRIGETRGFNVERVYDIPPEALAGGRNSLVVKITDDSSIGGFWGKAEQMFLEVDGKSYRLAGEWRYKPAAITTDFHFVLPSPNMYPTLLYNAMIHPLIRYPVKGAIWYQGENNAGAAYDYRTLFPALIRDWRAGWGYTFPFYWVQLANFMAKEEEPKECEWAELREAQTLTLALPQTGQAVITDLGEARDIHPRNKQDVGARLAAHALKKDYGKSDLFCESPVYRSMEVLDSGIVLSFDHTAGGLVCRNKYGYIEGFAIAGADRKFVWAQAFLAGDRVVVFSNRVKDPVAVRYSWSNNPDVNLYNSAGLPVTPFKTDDWEWITQRD